jgi:hypothetical protein
MVFGRDDMFLMLIVLAPKCAFRDDNRAVAFEGAVKSLVVRAACDARLMDGKRVIEPRIKLN